MYTFVYTASKRDHAFHELYFSFGVFQQNWKQNVKLLQQFNNSDFRTFIIKYRLN